MRPREVLWNLHYRDCPFWRRGAITETPVSTMPPSPGPRTTKPRRAAVTNQDCRAPLDQHPLPGAVVSTPRRPPRFCRRLVVTRDPVLVTVVPPGAYVTAQGVENRALAYVSRVNRTSREGLWGQAAA